MYLRPYGVGVSCLCPGRGADQHPRADPLRRRAAPAARARPPDRGRATLPAPASPTPSNSGRSWCSPPTRCATSCAARATTSTRTSSSAERWINDSDDEVRMAESVDLDAQLDELFATAPDGFVAAREALVRALKQAGRPDGRVHGARRAPTHARGVGHQPDESGRARSRRRAGGGRRGRRRPPTWRQRHTRGAAGSRPPSARPARRADRGRRRARRASRSHPCEHRGHARRRLARQFAAGRPAQRAPHRGARSGRSLPRRRGGGTDVPATAPHARATHESHAREGEAGA